MEFIVTKEIFERFPEFRAGVVIAKGISKKALPEGLKVKFREAEETLKQGVAQMRILHVFHTLHAKNATIVTSLIRANKGCNKWCREDGKKDGEKEYVRIQIWRKSKKPRSC